MSENEKRLQEDVNPSLEATIQSQDESTDLGFQDLVREAFHSTSSDDVFGAEPECEKLVSELAELGPPVVSLRKIGHYQLLEKIGAGGMGEVWKGRQTKLNRIVALKILHPKIPQTPNASDRFEQEMRAIGALQHPNIVQAVDAGEIDGIHYLAMEYIEGRSLSEVIDEQKNQSEQIPVIMACDLIRQGAVGLQYAHENGIVHRDIKPSNMMLTTDGSVKLLDLGLARLNSTDEPLPELTVEGQVMGTLDYVAPEQLRDSRSVGPAADVYSLGATFYKLLVGHAPFQTSAITSMESKLFAIAGEAPVSVRELRPDVPEAVSDLIDDMLKKSATERPQSVAKVLTRLDAAMAKNDPETAACVIRPPSNDEATEVLPKAMTGSVTNRPGNNRRRLLMTGGAFGMTSLLLLGVLIKLKDPKFGELTIEAPDGVQVRATKADDPEESFVFTAGGGNSTLSVGAWKITVEGDEFKEFVVEGDGLVQINGSDGDVVRISRRAIAVTDGDEPTLLPKSSERRPEETAVVFEVVKKAKDTSQPATELFVNPGPGYPLVAGLLPAPAELPGIPGWNLRTVLPIASHSGEIPLNCGFSTLSDDGQTLVWANEAAICWRNIERGNIHRTLPFGLRYLDAFAVSSDASQIAILADYRSVLMIVDGRNTTTHSWNPNFSDTPNDDPIGMQWMPDDRRLLIWNRNAAKIVDSSGTVQTLVKFPEGGGPSWVPGSLKTPLMSSVDVNSSGDAIAFGCLDGCIRVWTPTDNRLNTFEKISHPTEGNQYLFHTVRWSADDEKLVSGFSRYDAVNQHIHIWRADGTPGPDLGMHDGWGIGWSPDSRYVVTGDGEILALDGSGNSVETLPVGNSRMMTQCAYRQPVWSSDGVLRFLSQSAHGLRCFGHAEALTPGGRRIDQPRFFNPLSPKHTAWLRNDSGFRVVYSAGRQRNERWTSEDAIVCSFNPDGTCQSSFWLKDRLGALAPIGTTGLSWKHTTVRTQFVVYDVNGHEVSQFDLDDGFDVEPNLLGTAHDWNRDGAMLAIATRHENQQFLEIRTTQGELVKRLEINRRFAEWSTSIAWSPDGQFVAVCGNLPDQTSIALVWNINQLNTPVVEIAGPQPVFGRPFRWSEDSRWLALTNGHTRSSDAHFLRLWHVDSGQIFEPDDIHTALQSPEWVGGQFQAGSELLRVSADAPDGVVERSPLPFAVTPFENVFLGWGSENGTVVLRSLNKAAHDPVHSVLDFRRSHGDPVSFPFHAVVNTDALIPAHSDLQVLPVNSQGLNQDAVMAINLSDQSVDSVVTAFDDGTTISLSPSGRLLDGPEDIDSYLRPVVRYPGGAEITLTHDEFRHRIGLDDDLQAVNWILDIRGSLRTSADTNWMTGAEESDPASRPDPKTVVAVDLSGLDRIANESLKRLSDLPNVTSVDLSGSSITSISALSSMENLTVLDLSETAIDSVAELANTKQLTTLNLSRTSVASGVTSTLRTMPKLTHLDLSYTAIDEFGIDELADMTSLESLNLTGVDVPEGALADLKKSLSDCDVITDQP